MFVQFYEHEPFFRSLQAAMGVGPTSVLSSWGWGWANVGPINFAVCEVFLAKSQNACLQGRTYDQWTGLGMGCNSKWMSVHDDVIKWKHFPCNWPFVWGIHRSPVNYPCKGQWRGALMFSLICAWINNWVNNGEAGDLRCHRAHYNVSVMFNVVYNHEID